MNQETYRPLGTRVLLKMLPPKESSGILLPDGQNNPTQLQHFEVVGLGGNVNDDKFQLNIGETVVISAHQSQVIGISKESNLVLVDRSNIAVVVESPVPNN